MSRKEVLKDLIFNIKKSEKNVFSDTSGLKGYRVSKSKFPATREGYVKANKKFLKGKVGSKLEYLY